jgi:gluconolactonase
MTAMGVRQTATPNAFVHEDAAFAAVTGSAPALVRLIDVDAHEGPTYLADQDALFVTTVPKRTPAGPPRAQVKRIALDGDRLRLDRERISVVQADVVTPNGMTRRPNGALVVCDQGDLTHDARLSQVDPGSGATTSLVTAYDGRPLNSPNDVAVHGDGAIWFTDPSYGYLQGFRPPPRSRDHLYRLHPASGRMTVVADHFDKPNGLVFSPDQGTLYVTDSGANQEPGSSYRHRPHHVYAYDVLGGSSLGRQRVVDVTAPGIPDGITVDAQGRVYVSCGTGVRVLSPEGDLLGRINLPGVVNFTFGGLAGNHLFITTDTAVWVAVLDTKGV